MPDITWLELIIYGVVTFLTAIFGGIAGAGGGFIVTPLLIFFGASPAQAVATGKVGGLTISLASLRGMRGIERTKSRRSLIAIIVLSVLIGLAAPAAITRLDSEVYRNVLAIMLLVMIPILIIKKVGHTEHHPGTLKKIAGYGLLVVALGLQAVFASGLGTLVVIVFMGFLGMSALEANLTKRYSQVVLNVVVIAGLLSTGLIMWKVAAVGSVAAGAGGYIGGHMAAKKGNAFVMTILIISIFIAALELLFG